MIKSILKSALVAVCMLSVLGLGEIVLQTPILIENAEAASREAHRRYETRARRTTRRVVRSTHVYVRHLPAGCTTVVVNGAHLHRCGRTYYRPHGGQYVVVVIE